MNHKPSLTFIYLVVLMGMVTVMGLAWAVWQASRPSGRLPPVVTRPSPIAVQQIATSSFTPSPSALPIPTLPPYDASMSPTAAVFAGHLTPTLPPYTVDMSPTAPIPEYMQRTWEAEMTRRSATVTPTFTPSPTVDYVSCGWQWARQDLPEVTVLAQDALRTVDFDEVSVHVEAYGENCLNPDMTVRYFAAMTTDFYVSLPVSSLSDMEALTQKVVIIYTLFSTLPQDKFPARLGYLDFTFTSGAQTRRLRAMFDEYRTAINASKTGQELLDALGGLH